MKMIMKSRNLGLAALLATSIALLGSCINKEEQPLQQTEPVTTTIPESVKTVDYSVIVSGSPETKATVDADMKTLRFASGDKLFITSDSRTDLRGFLTLKAGDEGKASGATFTGTLEYTGDAPTDGLGVKATLVGTANLGFTISSDGKAIEGAIAYPSASFCTDVNDAVEKYSNLTGTSTYGARSFTLTQGTAFLNFAVTVNDGTATATDITATVKNGATTLSTATVTTATVSEKVMARFVLPVAAATTLDGATVTIGGNHTPAVKNIGNTTLTAKVYNVKRDVLTLGDLFYSDASVSTTLVDGKTPIGVIAYLGTDQWSENGVTLRDNTTTLQSHGLVLCLKNVATNVKWSTGYANEFGVDKLVSDVNGLKRETDVSGYTNTKALATKADAETNYPAFYQAWNYTTLLAPASTTGWFIPSAQQWVRMQTGLGEMSLGALTVFNNYYASEADDKWEMALAKAGSGNYDGARTGTINWYWSSTEKLGSNNSETQYAIILNVDNNGFRFTGQLKLGTFPASYAIVRPVLAF